MNYYLELALALFIYMNVWFAVSLTQKRNDVADVAWGLGFVMLAWVSYVIGGSQGLLSGIVTVMVSVWGLRLAWHIQARHNGKPEDFRYQAWRKAWGKWLYPRSYAQIYMLQGLFLYMISLPVLLINHSATQGMGILSIVGVIVWLVGFGFEVIGDSQLSQFINDPASKGQLLRSGLWQYSRHPNYFGEVTQWWGIWLMALPLSYGWVTVIGPLTITFLILKVSGVPMLEKKMAEKPGFADYKRTTSVFIPWFKKT